MATVEMIVGAAMVLTGMKKGEYAITVNARKDAPESFIEACTNLLIKNYVPPDFLLRNIVQEAKTYNEALKMLNSTNIAASMYYTISGKENFEGAVLERNPTSIHAFYAINSTNWFLVQTNYDRDRPGKIIFISYILFCLKKNILINRSLA